MNEEVATIRLATAADARKLAELRYEFRSALAPVNEDEARFVARCCAWMEARLTTSSHWHCWVAEQSDTIIGHLWLQLIEKIPNPVVEAEYHAYITNVFVQPDSRHRGLGARLLRTALDWCREHEVETVILWPTSRSRTLYLRHGFVVSENILALDGTASELT